jgi:hypothetical protein
MITVFISYKHESREREQRVRAFADELQNAGRTEGVSVILDQYFERENGGGPNGGWEIWSENEAHRADFILAVASRQYFDGYNLRHPRGTAPGIIPEIFIIRERIKAEGYLTGTVRPLVLHADDVQFVPIALKHLPYFGADTAKVIRWITGAGTANVPLAAWPPSPPPFDDWIVADCDDIRAAFASLLIPGSAARILLIKGEGKLGKSMLTEELAAASSRLGGGPLAARLDLKSDNEIRSLLGTFARKLLLTDVYNATITDGEEKCFAALFDALGKRHEPTVLLFDTFDQSGALGEWVLRNILPEAAKDSWLRVVIAGRVVPFESAEWRGAAVRHILKKLEWTEWRPLRTRLRPELSDADLETVHKVARGDHLIMRLALNTDATA